MGLLDIPVVGDVIGTGLEIAGAGYLQNDAQAHSAQMFTEQVKHDKDMFGLESAFSSAQAEKAYERQRSLLQDSPGLQMKGLKSAGLNPILAATGGFKSPAGGSMPIPRAASHSSAKGDSTSSPSISRVQLGQARLLNEQAKLTSAQKAKVEKETEFVGNKIDISEPLARIFDKLVEIADNFTKKGGERDKIMDRLIEQDKQNKQDLRRVWNWLLDKYGNAQKAFEEIRRNKGVINLPNIEVK